MGFGLSESKTVDVDVDVDITMTDIINNLDEFSSFELDDLVGELVYGYGYEIIYGKYVPSTLYDDLKESALIELSDKYTLDEIYELIKKK